MNERMLRGVSYRRREGEPMRRRAFARALLGCAMVGCLGCGASGAHAQEGAYEMTYEGGESEIIAAGSALFSQAENGLPGDTFTGYASIENESGGPCEFFTAMRDVVADGPEDMLERIAFTVVADGDSVIFDGSLSDAAGAEPISLGVVDPGEQTGRICGHHPAGAHERICGCIRGVERGCLGARATFDSDLCRQGAGDGGGCSRQDGR